MSVFYSSLVAARIGVKRLVLFTLVVSLLLNLALGVTIVGMRPEVRTIILPPTLAQEREVWSFDDEGPSDAYLSRFALSTLKWATDITPQTVVSAHETLLKFVDPAVLKTFDEALTLQARQIKHEAASSYFAPSQVTVNRKALRVDIKGDQTMMIGNAVTSRTPAHYVLTFRYDAGRLFLTRLNREDHRDE